MKGLTDFASPFRDGRELSWLADSASVSLSPPPAPLVAVYAVRGQTALLPCNLTSGDLEDPVILVLWYKNGTKTPVFRCVCVCVCVCVSM
ncbi:hypothetical protein E2C01_050658 [Portunus trituberculatus]|uniref:Ig-like domain-containing protein n=1 Tax=Portunus trituberculatus TaxID=210409 RepID=A0A5B7GH33_PORTR|nr:hypothetical protein [Portunus trituberculatus]